MSPISEEEKVLGQVPERVAQLSFKACLGYLLDGKTDRLYDDAGGGKGYTVLVKPLRELVEYNREYASYVFANIDTSGKVQRGEIKTEEEWNELKQKRRDRILSLSARDTFINSSRDIPQTGSIEKRLYGE